MVFENIGKREKVMNTLLSVSVALLAGLLMTRLFKPFKLPAVTAYLIAGVLIGPYCMGALGIEGLGFNSMESMEHLAAVSQVALGFIAFSIGNEFRLEDLKHTGKQALVIGIFQALVATLFVDLALLAIHMIMPDKLTLAQTLTLGAIATATAPAATLMVVRQYKAKGPLTNLLLPIVALDDAVGLIVFAVCFGIAKTLVSGTVDMISILLNPLIGLNLSAFGCRGFVVTFQPTCTIFAKIAMINPNAKNGNTIFALIPKITLNSETIDFEFNSAELFFRKSGIILYT